MPFAKYAAAFDDLGAEQIERRTEPEIEVFLHRGKIDRAGPAHQLRIVGAEFLHHFEACV
jgi:hypothetical protein